MTKTIKEVLQKLEWLQNIIEECQSMDKYHKMGNKSIFLAWTEVEELIERIIQTVDIFANDKSLYVYTIVEKQIHR